MNKTYGNFKRYVKQHSFVTQNITHDEIQSYIDEFFYDRDISWDELGIIQQRKIRFLVLQAMMKVLLDLISKTHGF